MAIKRLAMNAKDKFLFDLNGYIIIRDVFTKEEISKANLAIDHNLEKSCERTGSLRNTSTLSGYSGDGNNGRIDLGGMLQWEAPHRDVFRRVLTHPKLIPYFTTLIGKGYRLDHLPLCIIQHAGSEGFDLHGGRITNDGTELGHFESDLAYSCTNGTIYNPLIACSVQLVDHDAGDGGFVVLPGSHKANFPPPKDIMTGKFTDFDLVQQPVTKAGDVVIFSESTIHGASSWTRSDKQRRIALYRFSPSTKAFGRAYSCSNPNSYWPSSLVEGMSEQELAVVAPPYALYLDRKYLEIDGDDVVAVKEVTRNPVKKEFDKKVFGETYY